MDPSLKPVAGFDGTQATHNHLAIGRMIDGPAQLLVFILRFLAVITTFIAFIVMAVAKQTKLVSLNDLVIELTVKSTGTGVSQLEYFIAVNVIAFVYSLVSLVLSVVNRHSASKNLKLTFTIVDLIMVAFLFSGNGSAAAFSVLSHNGSDHLWARICFAFNKFCGNIVGAIVVSMFGTTAFFCLLLISIVELHRNSL